MNISDLENLENNIKIFFKKNGCPDIFVNCSYPVTKDWKLSSFKKNKLKILRKNVDISLNSGSWLAYKTEKMREKKIKGCNFVWVYLWFSWAEYVFIQRHQDERKHELFNN